MEDNPNKKGHMLTLSQGQGDVYLQADAIVSVARGSTGELTVAIKGHMNLYVDNVDGLHAELLRSMAACAEYADAQAELASEAIK